jgi:hypothetical protein
MKYMHLHRGNQGCLLNGQSIDLYGYKNTEMDKNRRKYYGSHGVNRGSIPLGRTNLSSPFFDDLAGAVSAGQDFVPDGLFATSGCALDVSRGACVSVKLSK